MSIVTFIPSGLQIHQQFGGGLVLHDSNYYSIAPKQKKLQAKLEILLQHLCILNLFADLYKPVGRNGNKTEQAAVKVQKEALPLPAKDQISAAIRHSNNGASGASDTTVLFPGNFVRCKWPFLHWLTLESHSSRPQSFGYKRVGSPASGNQSGEKKQRSGQENNDGNNRKGNRGNGQGPGKKKRGFGSQQRLIKKFACLFYKLDSGRYECCAGYNLTKWDHVLQHLKRIHLIQGEHCPNCREEFEGESAEAEKNEHTLRNSCQKKTAFETGLLLEEEYNDLTGLHGSHEEKWYSAWRKLFQGYPTPYSPFIETLGSLLEMHCNTLEGRISSLLESHLHNDDSIPNTTNAILRLIRSPAFTSNPPEQEPPTDPPVSILGPLPRDHEIPAVPSTPEPLGPDTDVVPTQPDIQATESINTAPCEARSSECHQSNLDDSFLEDLMPLGEGFYDENEDGDQWINFKGDELCFQGSS